MILMHLAGFSSSPKVRQMIIVIKNFSPNAKVLYELTQSSLASCMRYEEGFKERKSATIITCLDNKAVIKE